MYQSFVVQKFKTTNYALSSVSICIQVSVFNTTICNKNNVGDIILRHCIFQCRIYLVLGISFERFICGKYRKRGNRTQNTRCFSINSGIDCLKAAGGLFCCYCQNRNHRQYRPDRGSLHGCRAL